MIVLDDITAARPEYRKIWQLNTLRPPQTTPDGVRLWNTAGGATGRLDVRMFWPPRDGRTVEILGGAEANSVFGRAFTPPEPAAPEAQGQRIMVSPKAPHAHDRFLAVLQACDAEPLPVEQEESAVAVTVRIADRIVVLAKDTELVNAPFEVTVPDSGPTTQVLCAGLAAGAWRIAAPGAAEREVVVEAGKNTLFLAVPGGRYRISPQPGTGAAHLPPGGKG